MFILVAAHTKSIQDEVQTWNAKESYVT